MRISSLLFLAAVSYENKNLSVLKKGVEKKHEFLYNNKKTRRPARSAVGRLAASEWKSGERFLRRTEHGFQADDRPAAGCAFVLWRVRGGGGDGRTSVRDGGL
jgi:hypothetical protein